MTDDGLISNIARNARICAFSESRRLNVLNTETAQSFAAVKNALISNLDLSSSIFGRLKNW